jgi:hypothetical protein
LTLTRWCVLAALLGGCAAGRSGALDPSLVDAPATSRVETDPTAVLAEGAGSLDPGIRAHALAWLVRLDPAPGSGPWGPRAMWDPDAWVQRRCAEALLERPDDPVAVGLLEDLVRRATVDPYVRGAVALRLFRAGHTGAAADLAREIAAERAHWRAAPLALALASQGDAAASGRVATAVASGALPLEPGFFDDIGSTGLTALIPALVAGEAMAEPELVLSYAAARLTLGDASADGTFRRALADDDPLVRLEAVLVLSKLDGPWLAPSSEEPMSPVVGPAVASLLDRAVTLGPDLVRAQAQLVIASRDATAAAQIRAAWSSDDPEVRAMALRAVGPAAAALAADKKALRALQALVVDAIADPSPSVRLEALRAATQLTWSELPDGVTAALTDEAQSIRTEAAALTLLTR